MTLYWFVCFGHADLPHLANHEALNARLHPAEVDANERDRVMEIKARAKYLFAPEHGGSYEAFIVRPLSQGIIDYCIVVVAYMPILYRTYNLMLENTVSLGGWGYWARMVIEATNERAPQAQGPDAMVGLMAISGYTIVRETDAGM